MKRYSKGEVTLEEFVSRHLEGNEPAVLGAEWTADWAIRREFADGWEAGLAFLHRRFGHCSVPVSREGSCEPETWRLSDFLRYLRGETSDEGLLYLKDWHVGLEEGGSSLYAVPPLCAWDWMNEYWLWKADEGQKDYRFLYLGPSGSSTALHADVLRSFSWSANVAGRKRWLLLPPGAEARLAPSADLRSLAPGEAAALGLLDVEQGPGELLFVPSDWHHQVHNLQPTLSINHNWFNAANVARVWAHLEGRLAAVEAEIADARDAFGETDWRRQCQVLLRSDAGLHYPELRRLLDFIRQRRERGLPAHLSPDLICKDLAAVHKFTETVSKRCKELSIDEEL